jgi:hypothetical protein
MKNIIHFKMRKLIIPVLFLAMMLASCKSQKPAEEPKTIIAVDNVLDQAPSYVDQLVRIDGMVVHVCRESGKRIFLGEGRFKVLASNSVAKFDVALEGSDIQATGYIREDRIDHNYLDEWEKELKGSAIVPLKEEVHTGEAEAKGENESAVETQLRQINDYRDQIAAGGKGYISFYSLEVVNLKEVK